jgi:acylphosphatase
MNWKTKLQSISIAGKWYNLVKKLSMPTVRLVIKGKVQGVFYRASAREMAEKLGITGWIKNNAEGDVEALITGSQHNIDHFVSWCWQGPARARVDTVEVKKEEERSFDSFQVIRGISA